MKLKINFLLVALISIGVLLRLWNLNTDLLFHRDQGLHSLDIWNLWHDHSFKLLGPPSDVDGLYHAPIYYWIMTPAYFISGGDPFVASAFQILLEAFSLFFLFSAIEKLFNRKTAYLTVVFYLFSYGLISYSRWLVNVTPIFPIVNFLLFFLTSKKQAWWHPLLTSFLVGVATQCDAAVGIFLYPFLFWLYRSNLNIKTVLFLLIGFFLPASPLLLFELRHNFVITKATLNFSSNNNQGLGFSLRVLIINFKTLLTQTNYLLSFPKVATSSAIFIWGLFSVFKLKERNFIYIYLLFFFLSLSLFQRGAHGFFLVPLFPLIIACTVHGLTKLPKPAFILICVYLTFLNFSQYHNLYQPNNALIPIGDANIITLQDRKNIIDWVYQKSNGKPFSYWTYTLPYYQEYAFDYILVWYAKPKYGYLPEKTSSFSPGDLKESQYFFNIYEKDHDNPSRQDAWFEQASTNFGQVVDSYQSHDVYVELRSWNK